MDRQRRAVHITSEAAALAVGVPFLVWASYQTSNPSARDGLRAMALATVLVDGWLLWRWYA